MSTSTSDLLRASLENSVWKTANDIITEFMLAHFVECFNPIDCLRRMTNSSDKCVKDQR